MNQKEAKLLITQLLLEVKKNKLYNHIKKNIPLLYNYIQSYYNWPINTSGSTKIFWILNNITEIPKCIVCNNPIGINNISRRTGKYRLHCSHECACNSPHAREEYKKTCLQKYGVEHNMKCQQGLDEYSNSILKKYGVKYITQSKEIQDKIKNTNLKKYDSCSPFGSKEIQEKAKQTNIFKYGAENVSQVKSIREKIVNSLIRHYGVNVPAKNSEVLKKIKNTMFRRYGVEYGFTQKKCIEQNSINSKLKSYFNIILKDQYDIPLFSAEEYCNRLDDSEYLKFRCKKCGNDFLASHHDGYHRHCPECYPISSEYEQNNIVKFIQSLGIECMQNCRNIIAPLEIDIFIPSKNIAIEYDGLYWHSSNKFSGRTIEKKYHLNKTEQCLKKGIKLIHIFENEWILKQDIVKGRIKNILGIYDKIIFARKCIIKEIDSKDSIEFQNENHLQGGINAKVNIGLFFENQLVSLMTFGKSRFQKKIEWEMLRFCNKIGYHIPGAASKLLKYFEKKYLPSTLVSYADRRWSNGNIYYKLGFKLDHCSIPNYWYSHKNLILESRIKYQKHKLKNILDNFNDKLSEKQNMINNGYFLIYDCGNMVFTKEY